MQPVQAVTFLNPEGLPKNPAFSQVAVVPNAGRTVYVGGQDAVDAEGNIVGPGDLGAQAGQVLKNLRTALQAGGATLSHVVKWNVYVVQGQSPGPAFAVFEEAMREMTHPPLISLVYVAGLAHPDFLLEIDAIAVVP